MAWYDICWHSIWHSFGHILWHSIWHFIWHSIWHSFWHMFLTFFLASILTFSLAWALPTEISRLRSGSPLSSGACAWGARGWGEGGGGGGGRDAPLIESRDLHLAGEQKWPKMTQMYPSILYMEVILTLIKWRYLRLGAFINKVSTNCLVPSSTIFGV